MDADDFVRAVAFDPLRSCVPVRDAALRVEHENGVISDTLDEQSKAPLAFQRRKMRLAIVRHITRYFRETDEFAVFLNRVHDDHRPEAASVFANAPALRGKSTFLRGLFQNLLGNARI